MFKKKRNKTKHCFATYRSFSIFIAHQEKISGLQGRKKRQQQLMYLDVTMKKKTPFELFVCCWMCIFIKHGNGDLILFCLSILSLEI